MKRTSSQQGAVLLFTVLVVGFAAVALMSTLATAGFHSFVDSDQHVSSVEVRAALFGCLDEFLIELNEDPNLNPTLIETPDAACSATVVNEGGDNRSADLSLTQGNITRSVHVEVTVNGIQLTDLVEE